MTEARKYTDTITTPHILPSGTRLRQATIMLCKITDIDIDLWTMPKPSEPVKSPLKPV